MKYNEIFGQLQLQGESIGGDQCLAWTANYETGVFDIMDEIHPAAVTVWMRTRHTHIYWVPYISKFQLINGKWERVEVSQGNIPFVNYNPFKPRELMASSRAESKFPQNQ